MVKLRFFFIIALFYASFFCFNLFAQEVQVNLNTPNLRYSAHDFRDPFKSYLPEEGERQIGPGKKQGQEKGATLPDFSIQGLIWGGKVDQAIIDDTVVNEGDVIKDAKIIDIDKEGITFLFNDQEFKISGPAYGSNQMAK